MVTSEKSTKEMERRLSSLEKRIDRRIKRRYVKMIALENRIKKLVELAEKKRSSD